MNSPKNKEREREEKNLTPKLFTPPPRPQSGSQTMKLQLPTQNRLSNPQRSPTILVHSSARDDSRNACN